MIYIYDQEGELIDWTEHSVDSALSVLYGDLSMHEGGPRTVILTGDLAESRPIINYMVRESEINSDCWGIPADNIVGSKDGAFVIAVTKTHNDMCEVIENKAVGGDQLKECADKYCITHVEQHGVGNEIDVRYLGFRSDACYKLHIVAVDGHNPGLEDYQRVTKLINESRHFELDQPGDNLNLTA